MALRSRLARVPVAGPALIDFARRLRDPEAERAVQADLKETQRSLAWLREETPSPSPAAKRLLIVSLSDMVYQLKIEAMLGAAMRLAGWRPLVLTNSPTNTRGLGYFRAFGIDDFVFLDDFAPTAAERATAAEGAAR